MKATLFEFRFNELLGHAVICKAQLTIKVLFLVSLAQEYPDPPISSRRVGLVSRAEISCAGLYVRNNGMFVSHNGRSLM
jgi:hypothetical protein